MRRDPFQAWGLPPREEIGAGQQPRSSDTTDIQAPVEMATAVMVRMGGLFGEGAAWREITVWFISNGAVYLGT